MVVLGVASRGLFSVLLLFVIEVPHLLRQPVRFGLIARDLVGQLGLLISQRQQFVVVLQSKLFLVDHVLVQQVTLTHFAVDAFLEFFEFLSVSFEISGRMFVLGLELFFLRPAHVRDVPQFFFLIPTFRAFTALYIKVLLGVLTLVALLVLGLNDIS